MEQLNPVSSKWPVFDSIFLVSIFMVSSPVEEMYTCHSHLNISHVDAEGIGTKEIEYVVIPPALFKVRQPRRQESFKEFKHCAQNQTKTDVTDYKHLDIPPEEVCTDVEVRLLSDIIEHRGGMFRSEDPTVLCVQSFNLSCSCVIRNVVKYSANTCWTLA